MLDKDINVLLTKAEELKALFILGQRVVPFLEEIFIFIREISPILDGINSAIEDNVSKMPRASEQLSQVTEATELATNEIMDILDGFMYKCDVISGNVKQLNESDAGKATPIVDNSETLLNSLRSDASQIMMALQVQDITSQQLAAVKHLLMTVQGKLGSILKHFGAANFSGMFDASKMAADSPDGANTAADGKPGNVVKMHREIAFDSDAIDAMTSKSGARQDDVENILSAFEESGGDIDALKAAGIDVEALSSAASPTKKTEQPSAASAPAPAAEAEPASAASQDDIDALFAQTDDKPAADSGPASQDDIDSMFESSGDTSATDDAGPASQDDIDSMFEQSTSGDAQDDKQTEKSSDTSDDGSNFSQDDIDAMFGNS